MTKFEGDKLSLAEGPVKVHRCPGDFHAEHLQTETAIISNRFGKDETRIGLAGNQVRQKRASHLGCG